MSQLAHAKLPYHEIAFISTLNTLTKEGKGSWLTWKRKVNPQFREDLRWQSHFSNIITKKKKKQTNKAAPKTI